MNILQDIKLKKLCIAIFCPLLLSIQAQAQFKPSTEPIFKTTQAKPNIHMLLDDSGSMDGRDFFYTEHALGFGQPVCSTSTFTYTDDATGRTMRSPNWYPAWKAERERLGEYDPFSTNEYVPWNDQDADANGLIGGKKKPPLIGMCKNTQRSDGLSYAVQLLVEKYQDKAYIGMTFMNNRMAYDTYNGKKFNGKIGLLDNTRLQRPLIDFTTLDNVTKNSDYYFYDGTTSYYDLTEYKYTLLRLLEIVESPSGSTPARVTLYDVLNMYRGYPLDTSYGYYNGGKRVQFDTPLRYRCQSNNVIVMTDGYPNDERSGYGVAVEDVAILGNQYSRPSGSNSNPVNGIYINRQIDFENKGMGLAQIAANTDLRNARKPLSSFRGYDDDEAILVWGTKDKDDAGKDWNDPHYSTPMPINIHTVSLAVDPNAKFFREITTPGGMNFGIAGQLGNSNELLSAFDQIFAAIIRSTSSTKAVMDRTSSNIKEGIPPSSSDLQNLGSLRYDSVYSFRQRFGTIRAVVPYIEGYEDPEQKEGAIVKTYQLWDTNSTILPGQTKFLTLTNSGSKELANAVDEFRGINPSFGESAVDWIVNFDKTDFPNNMRARLYPLGSITNSDITLANKDILYTNIKYMPKSMQTEMKNYLLYKSRHQPTNLIIVGDNDGVISFINAQRGLKVGKVAGAREFAYFPRLFVPKIDEITKMAVQPQIMMEGKIAIADGEVQLSDQKQFVTLGLSGLGSGGKGIVGFQIFKASENDIATNKSPEDNMIQPLFEISNDETLARSSRDSEFGNLGYTYSGFEFFTRSTVNGPQMVAVFGNGYGAQKSTVYFIDAMTGEKISEVVLSADGGGASTPSIMVTAGSNGQVIDRLYVGDYSGNLYRVTFPNGNLTNPSSQLLFSAPTAPKGQATIFVKPLVVKLPNSQVHMIFFGTGKTLNYEEDRGNASMVQHNFFAVRDDGSRGNITIDNMKKGNISYKNTPNDYHVKEVVDLNIMTPEDVVAGSGKYGWYLPLTADGQKTGERIILNPSYDSKNKAVIFSTWGIKERGGLSDINPDVYDPCIADDAFGKIIAVDAELGRLSSFIGLSNKGHTATAPGNIVGEGISDNPHGNDETDIEDLDDIKDDLINNTSVGDSSYTTEEDGTGSYTSTDITGEISSSGADKGQGSGNNLFPRRVNVIYY